MPKLRFLSDRALKGLMAYQYKATGYTILDDIHQAPWNYIVSKLPMWLAPNLITLTGTLLVLMAYILNAVYLPTFEGDAPRWVYVLTAASVALYVNLDCMDGKQARRTGSSSPLGQLFDHGCDGLVLHMLLANIACSLGLPCGWKMAVGCLGIMAPWIVAQWEEYHTGVMVYGTRYYGVLEANYAICAVHLANAFFGARCWHVVVPIPPAIGQWIGLSGISIGDASLVFVGLAGVVQGLESCRRVVLTQHMLPSEERGHKQVGGLAAWLHLGELGLFLGLGAVWLTQARGAGVLHCRLAFSTFGLMYAAVALQVILAHMAKEPLRVSRWALLALGLGVANGVWPLVDPLVACVVLHTAAVAAYAVYAYTVVDQVCAALGIRCLTIPVLKPRVE